MKSADQSRNCPKCGMPVPEDAPGGLCPQCVFAQAAANEPSATATDQIPSRERLAAAFPQLQIMGLIGRGAMGFVFKARQPHLDRFVALKVLPDALAPDPSFAERFNREGRTLARLNHPNIVSIFEFGQAGGFYFLLMEFVDGVNLRQAMQAGRFSPAEALSLVPKICEALQFAHEEGILHRDIKPENILLDAKGRVKIADFGIAKMVGENQPEIALTATGAAMGTPHYMAPEQFEKPESVDHRADIYSLGVVFYELLTGELPIGRFAPPSQKTPVDTRVDDVVLRTLEKEREKRFQSAGEMKSKVEHLTATAKQASDPGGAHAMQQDSGGTRLIGADFGHGSSWSHKALWGAVLVGLSLPVPLLMFTISLFHHRFLGLGRVESLVVLATFSLPALAGTLLGWMALTEIRASRGTPRHLPMAIFAALAWPLFLLIASSLIPLAATVYRNAVIGQPINPLSYLLLLLPAGTITFGVWSCYAATFWGGNHRSPAQRGVLKWIFLMLLLFGLGAAGLGRPDRSMPGGINSLPDFSAKPSPLNLSPGSETWSPALGPDEKPDPELIRKEAAALTQEGKYEEALQRQLWYHNHVLQFQPNMRAVRLSFGLAQWVLSSTLGS